MCVCACVYVCVCVCVCCVCACVCMGVHELDSRLLHILPTWPLTCVCLHSVYPVTLPISVQTDFVMGRSPGSHWKERKANKVCLSNAGIIDNSGSILSFKST